MSRDLTTPIAVDARVQQQIFVTEIFIRRIEVITSVGDRKKPRITVEWYGVANGDPVSYGVLTIENEEAEEALKDLSLEAMYRRIAITKGSDLRERRDDTTIRE